MVKSKLSSNPNKSEDLVIEKFHPEGVVELRLNRPKSLNAFSSAMYHKAASLLDKHSNTSSTRIVVLTAAGRFFTAGMDIREAAESDKLEHLLNAAKTFMFSLMNCECIVVVSAFGAVTGIGVTMLMHCDIVFAHPFSTFLTPFYLLGIVPEYASSLLFPMFLGPVLSSKLLLRGETVSAYDMQNAGFVQLVDNNDNVNTFAVKYAVSWSRKLNNDQWKCVIEAKQLIRKTIRQNATAAINAEFKSIHQLNSSGTFKRLIATRLDNVRERRRAML